MLQLAILLRTLYFLKHNCHNLVSKLTFFSDHEFLGSSYAMTLDQYDSVIERMIGLGYHVDLISVQSNAIEKLKGIQFSYEDNSSCFSAILNVNKVINNHIENLCKAGQLTQGTIQLIGGIADQIEVENYKIGQRVKGN